MEEEKRKRGRPKGSKNKPKHPPAATSSRSESFVPGQKVCLTFDPDRVGKLVRVGEQQSEVAFSKSDVRIFVNKDIKPCST